MWNPHGVLCCWRSGCLAELCLCGNPSEAVCSRQEYWEKLRNGYKWSFSSDQMKTPHLSLLPHLHTAFWFLCQIALMPLDLAAGKFSVACIFSIFPDQPFLIILLNTSGKNGHVQETQTTALQIQCKLHPVCPCPMLIIHPTYQGLLWLHGLEIKSLLLLPLLHLKEDRPWDSRQLHTHSTSGSIPKTAPQLLMANVWAGTWACTQEVPGGVSLLVLQLCIVSCTELRHL